MSRPDLILTLHLGGFLPLGLFALSSGAWSCANPSCVPEEVPRSSLEVACDHSGELGWQRLLRSQVLS